ncbi:MAG: MFS transporter [bacterium]
MPTRNSRSIRLITAGSFFAFFLFGFADNMKGPTIPALLRDLNFSYSQGGTVLLGAYVGFLIATLLTGALSDIAGKKAVVFAAGASLFLGIAGYSGLSSFWALTTSMVVLGLGLGSLEVGGNTIIVDLHSRRRGRYLNLLSFFHGVGSMVAPLYAGQLLAAGLSWRRVYQLSLMLVILLPIYFLPIKYPKGNSSEISGIDLRNLGRSAFTGKMALFYFLIAFYVASEIGMASWIVEFLQRAKFQSVVLSSSFLSLFFGGITAGRLLGSFCVERVGYLRIMLYSSIASIACVALGTFGPPALALFLPLTGIFFSIMFPTTTAAVSDLHRENVGTILGLLFTFAGVGGMIGPWMVGLLSDWAGIEWGFGAILAFCISMFISLLALVRGKS